MSVYRENSPPDGVVQIEKAPIIFTLKQKSNRMLNKLLNSELFWSLFVVTALELAVAYTFNWNRLILAWALAGDAVLFGTVKFFTARPSKQE